MTNKTFPLSIALSAAQIEAGLATALEKLAVEISLAGVRRMLVDAAQAVAENRADLEVLLKVAGRLMDHFEPARAGEAAREACAEVLLPAIGSAWIRSGDPLTWYVEAVGKTVRLSSRQAGEDSEWCPISIWPGPYRKAAP